MKAIKGQRLLTISAEAGETYVIQYEAPHSFSILNQTDGNITISEEAAYNNDGDSAACFILSSGAFINNLNILSSTLCISSDGIGAISLVKTK